MTNRPMIKARTLTAPDGTLVVDTTPGQKLPIEQLVPALVPQLPPGLPAGPARSHRLPPAARRSLLVFGCLAVGGVALMTFSEAMLGSDFAPMLYPAVALICILVLTAVISVCRSQ